MFCLKRREDFCVYILPNQKKIFGKLGDIRLEGDATISRKHATVSVQLTDEADTQYKCVINDTSKYGTYIIRNNEKKQLLPNESFPLKADDIVQFGLKDTTFVVSVHTFVTARSSLDVQNVEKLTNIIRLIGGRISENLENSCTHLTVNKTVPVTAKITCALATLKPIVTIEYWEAVNIAIKEFKELPKIEDFLPKIMEELLNASSNLLLPNEKRRTLFKGLSFVHFCAKQYYAYASVITAAGGKSCVYPTRRPLTPRDLTAKNAIVIQQPVSDSSEITQVIPTDYPVIYRKLQDIKRRMISETEIPLAILHCSTEMYCNPLFKFGTLLKSKSHVLATNVMVEDTQDVVKIGTRQVERKIIPETYDSQDIQNLQTRVRFSDESEQRNIPHASTSGNVTQNAVKRNVGCKIIPETCSSLNYEKVSNESEQNISCASAKDTSMIVSENTIRKDNNRCETIIPETCNSSKIESVSKKNSFSYESEQRNISRVSKSGIATEIMQENKKRDFECKIIPETCTSSNVESISKKSQVSNESEQRNIVNVSLGNISRKCQVISETCRSPNVNVINIFSSNLTRKNNNKQPLIIFDKDDIVNKPEEKEQTISLHQRDNSEENILTPLTNSQQVENLFRENAFNLQQRENILMNEDDNFIFENVNLSSPKENNLIVEKNIGNNNNNKHKNTSQEKFKNSADKQIITIDETDDICMEQRKENNVPGKRATRQEPKKLLKERQLDSASNSDNNRNNRAKENETEEKNKSRDTNLEGNRHKRSLNQEYTDKLFRKDAPSGKKFKKALVIIPTRRLKEDDFY